MFRGLGRIVIKEVKEMTRDPRILLGMILAPLIIFPLMGVMFSASSEAVQESLRAMSIGIARAPTPLGYLILGISVFVSLLCALAVAIVVSVFAEDVR